MYANFVLKLLVKDDESIFLSREKEEDGLYETIFNKKTTFEDMLLSYKMNQFFGERNHIDQTTSLIASRILLEKLYPTNLNAFVNLALKEDKKLLLRLEAFIEVEMGNLLRKNTELKIYSLGFEDQKVSCTIPCLW